MATCGVDRGDPEKLKIVLRVGEPFCGTQACGGEWVVGGPRAWGDRGRPPGESNLAPSHLPTPASGTPLGPVKHPLFLLGSPGLTSQTPSLPLPRYQPQSRLP